MVPGCRMTALPPQPLHLIVCMHIISTVSRTERRDELKEFLSEHGVDTMVHYPIPVHQQDAYREKVMVSGSLPVTETICPRILSLPLHPYLSLEDIHQICNLIHQFLIHDSLTTFVPILIKITVPRVWLSIIQYRDT